MNIRIILLLLTGLHIGCNIKCHVCNSMEDKRCVDPFNVTTDLQDCHGRTGGVLDVVEIIMQNLEISLQEGRDSEKITVVPDPGEETMVCQKIVVIVKDKSITSRGCSPIRVDGMHPCDAVKLSTPQSTLQLRQCVTCLSDACNSTPAVRVSPLVSIYGALVAAIATTKHL